MGDREYLTSVPVLITVSDDGMIGYEIDWADVFTAPQEETELYDDNDDVIVIPEEVRLADQQKILTAPAESWVNRGDVRNG